MKPGGPPATNHLHYAFRYSQELVSSYGDWQTSLPLPIFDYANDNQRHPFSLTYGGGYTWTLAGQNYSTGIFQRLLLSQSFLWRKWKMKFGDDVSYRPQAPTTGFSGIAGTGEPIGGIASNPPTSQTILTLNSRVVDNMVNGEIEHRLNYAAILSASGGSELLRYPDGTGLDTNDQTANTGLTWRLSARDSILGNYQFSQFSYSSSSFSFTTNSGLFGFRRAWNKKLATDVSVGPQWTASSDSKTIPSSIGLTASAAINYRFGFVSAGLYYTRGTNGGSGYMFGAKSDMVSGAFSRQFGRDLSVGIQASYQRTAGLQNNNEINAKYGGVQTSRQIGRCLSLFASYTVMDQSSSSALPASALSGLLHVVGFGIGYSAAGNTSQAVSVQGVVCSDIAK